MKNLEPKLVDLFQKGFCAPQIVKIAKETKEPAATIHYNIKRMENEGKIRAYKAVFDYKKTGSGYCTYMLIRLNQENYGKSAAVSKSIARHPAVESVDIVTGDYEIIVKLRVKDSDEYYTFVQDAINRYGIGKTMSLTSLKQFKTEYVEV